MVLTSWHPLAFVPVHILVVFVLAFDLNFGLTWQLDGQHCIGGSAGWGCSPGSSSSSLPSCFMSGACRPCRVVVRHRGQCGWLHSGWPSFSLARAVIVGYCRRWPLSFLLTVIFVGRHRLVGWLCSLTVVWLVVVSVLVEVGGRE